MSTVKCNNAQIGQSATATNNFTWYQPSSPDGTVRLAVGNAGATTLDTVTVNSSGNVGIGTSSPTGYSAGKILQLFGSATAAEINMTRTTGSDLNFINGASAAQIGTQTSYPLTFITAGSERMRIDSSGNLGLGITPSGWNTYKALQVNNASLWGAANNSYVGANYYYASGSRYYIANGYATEYSQAAGVHSWGIAPSGTAGNAITFTAAMTLDASGNLLVGTTSAYGKLSVQAGTSATGNSLFLNNLDGTYNPYLQIQHSSNGVALYANSSYGGAASKLTCLVNSAGVYLSANATSWTAVSDERLKENLIPIEGAVAKVSTLRAVIGKYKTDEPDKRRSFLIAQDVQAVLPEAVDASDPDKLGVQYTDTIPLLVAAIKELSAELNELKAKVNA